MGVFDIRMKGFAVIIMLASLIAGVTWYYRRSKKEVLALGFVFRVQCEKCGVEYDVSTEEFLKHSSGKSRSVTKTRRKGAAIDNSPNYLYMAKRFDCPNCKRGHWAEVLNYGEYQAKARGIVLKNALIVFAILYLLVQVVMGIVELVEKIFG